MLLSSIKYLSAYVLPIWLAVSNPGLPSLAPNFVISQAELQLQDHVLYANVDADFDFSEPVLNALRNGVGMTIVLEIDFYLDRPYFPDKKIAAIEKRFSLEYFALTEQYVVSDMHTGERHTAMTLRAVINKLREIKPIAIIDQSSIHDNESYYAKIRVRLSLNSLPVPLQLNAYISTDWWLYSDWKVLSFTHGKMG